MGIKYRKRVGDKKAWLNVTRNGITSTSVKLDKDVTYNSKRGFTVNLPGGFFWTQNKSKAKPTTKNTEVVPISDTAFAVVSFIVNLVCWSLALGVLWLIWRLI